MKIIKVLKNPKYLLIAVISSIVMLVVYVYTQLLGIIENLDLWLTVIPWYNAILLIIFTTLFGATIAYQVYLWGQPKTCSLKQKVSGAGTSGAGTFGVFLVAQCPACASIAVLFLPVSVVGFLTQYSWVLNLITIFLLVFTLNYLGAFKKEIKD